MSTSEATHNSLAASPWVRRWAANLKPGSTVLDVACGTGRHARFLAELGHSVTGVDRDAAALKGLEGVPGITELVLADIEAGPWPFEGRQFDCVLVTNYLWRELLPKIVAAVAPGGTLIYETFAQGNQSFGKPSNPDFLLRPRELLTAATGLRVLAYEDGFLPSPERFVQRIAAMQDQGAQSGTAPDFARYLLA
ncbi:class I SAM-dependent methyltransferase [Roseateles toxinivorans]|uniref:Methyltransferase family protein n=1 Tax=Roseateles toxinivorans TaxID=270368 RepID=A0A4R6QTH5_9BURK|nr:class I SAM-dependent methyltransferase [Roseateles toxinivorans]TDP74159.1 methyltransferase family protein [Roseateles toxinivorans]